MKKILLISLFYSLNTNAQERHKGFVHIGPAGYQALKGGSAAFGGTMGFGVFKGIGSLGIGVEVLSEKKLIKFPAYADIRIHLKKSATGPFVMLQPGYVIANNIISRQRTNVGTTVTKDVGGVYIGCGAGFLSLVDKVGITCQVKFAVISSQLNTYGGGAKRSSIKSSPGYIGVSFGAAF